MLNHLGRTCEYSNDGKLIAVGMKDGNVIVLKADSLDEVKSFNNRNQEISDIKFSPSNFINTTFFKTFFKNNF